MGFFLLILLGLVMRALFWLVEDAFEVLFQSGAGADGFVFMVHAVLADMVILGALLVFAALAVRAFGKRTNLRDVELNQYKKPLLDEDADVPHRYRV